MPPESPFVLDLVIGFWDFRRPSAAASPDVHTLVGGADHWRTVRNIERFREFRQIREWSIHAIMRRRMRINVQTQLLVFVADFLPPDCRERKKESLLRR